MSKFIEMSGTITVSDDGVVELKKAIAAARRTYDRVKILLPDKAAASAPEFQLNFDGLTAPRLVFLRVDQSVTLKINQQTDAGFSFGPGDLWLESGAGITGIWITPGPNPTVYEAILAGD